MTLSAGTVSIGVKSVTKGFGSALHDSLKGEVAGVGKAIGGTIMAGIGAAVAGISAVAGVGIKETLDASKGVAQLNAGIKSTGNVANLSIKGMTDLASTIQNYSGQTDDSIVASEQLLQTFTNIRNNGPDKIFDLATVATADMAAKMGGDASGMAIKLGRALSDPVKGVMALTRVGVVFTQSQKDSIKAMVKSGDTIGAQKVILGELSREFGGAAKAAGKSLPGQLELAKRSFEDLSQGIVESALPLVLPLLKGISDFVLKTFVPGVGAMVEAFKAGGDDITSSGFAGVMERIGLAARKVADFATGTVIPGVKALAAAFMAGGDDVTSSGFAGVMEKIGLTARKVADFITGTVIPAIQNFITEFKNGTGAGGIFKTVLGDIWTANQKVITGVIAVVGFLKDHTTTTRIAATVVGLLVAAVQAHNIALFISSGRLKEWILQTTIVKVATGVWAAIQWILNAALTANPIGLVVAAIGLLVAGIVLVATKTTWFQTIWEYMSGALGKAWQWMWNSILAPIIRFVLNGFASITDGIANMLGILGHIPGFKWAKDAAAAMSGAADKAHALANGIKDIPNKVPVAVNFSSNFSVIGQQVASLIGSRNKLAAMGPHPGAASGMDNWRGGPLWVGEHGKELLDLPAGSKITTHSDSMKRATGGGGFDYDRMAAAMSRAQIVLDGKNVARSVDQRLAPR